MKVEDVYTQNRRLWVWLREKGGKRHEMPCHHNLEEYLGAYLDHTNLRDDPKGPLFRTIGCGTPAIAAARIATKGRQPQLSGDRHCVLMDISGYAYHDVKPFNVHKLSGVTFRQSAEGGKIPATTGTIRYFIYRLTTTGA
ncbi:MAG: hypothetical protein ABJA60_01935 [Nitrosospira sp.]